jgi:outer membrane protein OmpA-like peptidoglycan-associated protein
MLRLGPLVFGTNDLTTYARGDFFGANFYFLVKMPIPYGRVRDRDNDAVSNRKDKCKDQPGTWEFRGCPDKDLDHVLDIDDKCPEVAGLVMFNGCPDSDLDSIPDAQDACPEIKGLKIFNGCPDSDADGITDKEDECPFTPGPTEFKGCPDSDGDGIPDKDDACPTLLGFKELKGCPDRDLDSIADMDDACPEQAGPRENMGCPYPDGDKDGIFDKDDACPTVYGVADLKGCPLVTVMGGPSVNTQTVQMAAAEKKIIEKAFSSLEFATAKDVIKPTSFKGLDELAKLLLSHEKDWKIKLIGHTDNEGNAAKNMLLSEKRAKAVSAYLAKKGVPTEQLITEWHGQEQPVADNKTPAGRQRNRRVEMKIVLIEK